jgi:hypothetical protein
MRKKNNARESAKISLAFSLAFILQIQQIFSNFFAEQRFSLFFTRYRACLFLDKAADRTYYGVIPQHPV